MATKVTDGNHGPIPTTPGGVDRERITARSGPSSGIEAVTASHLHGKMAWRCTFIVQLVHSRMRLTVPTRLLRGRCDRTTIRTRNRDTGRGGDALVAGCCRPQRRPAVHAFESVTGGDPTFEFKKRILHGRPDHGQRSVCNDFNRDDSLHDRW